MSRVRGPVVRGTIPAGTNRIRELREARDLTQDELGKITGIVQSRIARLEAGEASLTPEELPRLCRALRCNLSDLFVPSS